MATPEENENCVSESNSSASGAKTLRESVGADGPVGVDTVREIDAGYRP
ncbi:hypothetical protein [Halorussus halophilus]|nr:hypothetical protein [Halorussus halophilus]